MPRGARPLFPEVCASRSCGALWLGLRLFLRAGKATGPTTRSAGRATWRCSTDISWLKCKSKQQGTGPLPCLSGRAARFDTRCLPSATPGVHRRRNDVHRRPDAKGLRLYFHAAAIPALALSQARRRAARQGGARTRASRFLACASPVLTPCCWSPYKCRSSLRWCHAWIKVVYWRCGGGTDVVPAPRLRHSHRTAANEACRRLRACRHDSPAISLHHTHRQAPELARVFPQEP